MIQKWRMMIARFPYGGTERTEIVDWTASLVTWSKKQHNIDTCLLWNVSDTPITMCRNLAVTAAIANNIDILIMIDSDMSPDIDRSKPFVPEAFEFIKSRWHTAPTIIAVPYLSAGPDYVPTIGRWRSFKNGFEVKTDLYTREEASAMSGIQPCSLMGTGVMAMDMRIFTGFEISGEMVKLPPPWFYYEYTDEYQTQKASTEDMVFTRNASMVFGAHGIEIGYCHWDCWAYHVKTQFVGKPWDTHLMDVVPVFSDKLLHEQRMLNDGNKAPEVQVP